MTAVLTLDGARIVDIATFYDEINRAFMGGVDWELGASLEALDDMLYGGYGALDGDAPVTLVWLDFEKSRHALGVEATRQQLLDKIAQPGRFDTSRLQGELAALEAGTGPTYFEIVLQILASHPNIALSPR